MSTHASARTACHRSLYRDTGFIVFWSARTISYAGTGITMVVLPVLTYRMTSSAGATASLAAIEAVPYLAVGLFAGAAADRVSRRAIMVASDLTAAFLLSSITVAAAFHVLFSAQLFVVALGVATAFVWFDAANFGALVSLVGRDRLPAASSMIWSTTSAALLAGPALGAALVAVLAPADVIALDAASYLASALLIRSLRQIAPKPPRRVESGSRIRADIADGLRFVRQQPVIRTMTVLVFATCVTWGGTFGLLVVYATRALHLAHAGPRLGLLYSAGELGGLVAALLVPRIVRRPSVGRVTAAVLLANAILLVLLSALPGYGRALLLFSCYEFTYALVLSVGITLRQLLTPDHLQARVNTTGRMIAYGGQPVGALLGGVMAEFLPIRVVFLLMTIGVATAAGLAVRACLRSGPLSAVAVPTS